MNNSNELYTQPYIIYRDSLVSQLVKNLPVMQEIPVQLLGQDDPPEKG